MGGQTERGREGGEVEERRAKEGVEEAEGRQ